MYKKTITRSHISDQLRDKCHLKRADAQKIIEGIIQVMGQSLKEKKEIKFPLFGVFFTRDKKERVGRNPRTLEEKKITARTVVGFRPSKVLRSRINEILLKANNKPGF